MSWLNENKRVWRLVSLVLIVIAFAGPWAFDLVNVPAEYPCSEPFIRLKGDFCGLPQSGLWILPGVCNEFIDLFTDLITGATGKNIVSRRFLVLLGVLFLLLPFINILAQVLSIKRQRSQNFQWFLWSLAAVSCLCWYLTFLAKYRIIHLWGYWLYVGLTVSMLIIEAMLASKKYSSQAS